jgi:hypothetical protein
MLEARERKKAKMQTTHTETKVEEELKHQPHAK